MVRSSQHNCCTNQLTWRRNHCNLGTSGWISTCEESIWGSFSRPIQWWGLIKNNCTNQLTWQEITVTWELVGGFQLVRSQFGVVFEGQSNDEMKPAILYKSADMTQKHLKKLVYLPIYLLFYCHFWSLIGTYFWGFESLIGLYKDPMCLRTLCRHSALSSQC